MAEDDTKHSTKHNALIKTGIVGVVTGLFGGGIAHVGLSQVNGQSAPQTSVVPTAEVEKSNNKNSSEMTNAFNTVRRSVISVVNLERQSLSSSNDPFGIFSSNSSNSPKKSSKFDLEAYSEGSDVIYMKSNGKGYIVANNHVVSGSDEIQVILSDDKKVAAEEIGTDSETNLAVLTIDGKYVTQTAQFSSSKNLEPGQQIIAIGSSSGSEYATSITQGIISAKNKTVDVTNSAGQVTGQTTVIQTDAAINPGNSDGLLVNMSGQVAEISSIRLSSSSDGTAVEGMGLAIPNNKVVSIINQLVKNGKVTRPKLGVRIVPVDELTEYGRKELGLPDSVKSGVYVASVTKNGGVNKAGTKSHDIITRVDGEDVGNIVSLHTALYIRKVSDIVTFQIIRDGKSQDTKVTLS